MRQRLGCLGWLGVLLILGGIGEAFQYSPAFGWLLVAVTGAVLILGWLGNRWRAQP